MATLLLSASAGQGMETLRQYLPTAEATPAPTDQTAPAAEPSPALPPGDRDHPAPTRGPGQCGQPILQLQPAMA